MLIEKKHILSILTFFQVIINEGTNKTLQPVQRT